MLVASDRRPSAGLRAPPCQHLILPYVSGFATKPSVSGYLTVKGGKRERKTTHTHKDRHREKEGGRVCVCLSVYGDMPRVLETRV